MRTLILIYSLLGACGDDLHYSIIEEEFRPYLHEYIAQGLQRGYHTDLTDLSIEFDDNLPLTHIGVCTRGDSGPKLIGISPVWWNKASDYHKLHMIAHELGHCLLDREHAPTRDSFMYKSINMRSKEPTSLDIYWDELFAKVIE